MPGKKKLDRQAEKVNDKYASFIIHYFGIGGRSQAMATRTAQEQIDLYDVLKTGFLNTTGSAPGDAIHTLLPKGIRYRDEEVGSALTRLLTEDYIGLFYKRGSGLFATGSSIVGCIRTKKLVQENT